MLACKPIFIIIPCFIQTMLVLKFHLLAGPGTPYSRNRITRYIICTCLTGIILHQEDHIYQNYPNPFNPVTTIRYELPHRSNVQLTIYDLLGGEVATLISETQDAGFKSVKWYATGISSGMYFYQISFGDQVQTKKLLLLK